jgi:GNAT superfamily N-acetyltransferase
LPTKIRAAVAADALAACEVLRRSIAELCVVDHDNDPEILGRWLANKTPEIIASWIARSDNSVLVAVEGDTILAVGSVTDGGEITLCYISPDARFRGISRALLGALENPRRRARQQALHLAQYPDRPALLPRRRLHRRRPAGRQVRRARRLPYVEALTTR